MPGWGIGDIGVIHLMLRGNAIQIEPSCTVSVLFCFWDGDCACEVLFVLDLESRGYGGWNTYTTENEKHNK